MTTPLNEPDKRRITYLGTIVKRTWELFLAAFRGEAARLKSLPSGTAIVRAMPNTPAAVGRGITVAVANGNVSAKQ